jgi:hypothetical protein
VQSIVPDILNFLRDLERGRYRRVLRRLQSEGISIITDFSDAREWMERFYDRYVVPYEPQIVICGINPGRFGSGRCGVPFLDFRALNELIGDTGREDSEKSARFFYAVVKHFGPELFYSTFYVTNVSWLGFTKDGRNINYYRLPEDIQAVILDQFVYEMDLVNPTHIISTGREVERTLASLKASGRIRADVGLRLRHPRWCGIDRNRAAGLREYVELLGRFIGPGMRE